MIDLVLCLEKTFHWIQTNNEHGFWTTHIYILITGTLSGLILVLIKCIILPIRYNSWYSSFKYVYGFVLISINQYVRIRIETIDIL